MDRQTNTPLVTIAIPAYKTAFLAEAISSALSQTYADIEVIVVDDASPNDVQGIVARFSDNRLSYHRNEKNLGKEDPSRNWNRCLELAKGDFICLLCDDDVYHKDFIAELISLQSKYPGCNAFRCGVKEIDSDGNTTEYYPLAPEHQCIEEYIWHLHSRNNRQTMSEWMLRTSALRGINGYASAPMAWGADCATIFRIGRNGGVASSARRLMSFRRTDKNITGRTFSYNQKKLIGWRQQCHVATEIVNAGSHPDKKMIIRTIEKDMRNETKFLVKHASIKELFSMYAEREKYGLTFSLFLKGIWQNIKHLPHSVR